MCNCNNELHEKLKQMFPNSESMINLNIEMLSGRYFSTMEIKEVGKKKASKQLIIHNYCPICGIKYEDKIKLESEE